MQVIKCYCVEHGYFEHGSLRTTASLWLTTIRRTSNLLTCGCRVFKLACRCLDVCGCCEKLAGFCVTSFWVKFDQLFCVDNHGLNLGHLILGRIYGLPLFTTLAARSTWCQTKARQLPCSFQSTWNPWMSSTFRWGCCWGMNLSSPGTQSDTPTYRYKIWQHSCFSLTFFSRTFSFLSWFSVKCVALWTIGYSKSWPDVR